MTKHKEKRVLAHSSSKTLDMYSVVITHGDVCVCVCSALGCYDSPPLETVFLFSCSVFVPHSYTHTVYTVYWEIIALQGPQ